MRGYTGMRGTRGAICRASGATRRRAAAARRRETFAKSIESVTSQKTRRWKEADGVDGRCRVEKCPVTRIYRLREECERGKHRELRETSADVKRESGVRTGGIRTPSERGSSSPP